MSETKIVVRCIRFTKTADDFIEKLCNSLNRYNLKINGDDEVCTSNLLGYVFEKMSHNKQTRLETLSLLLKLLDTKNPVSDKNDDNIVKSVLVDVEK